jgi:hypothetical protein
MCCTSYSWPFLFPLASGFGRWSWASRVVGSWEKEQIHDFFFALGAFAFLHSFFFMFSLPFYGFASGEALAHPWYID